MNGSEGWVKIGENYTMQQFLGVPDELFEDLPILIRMRAPDDRFDALRPGLDVETRPETGCIPPGSNTRHNLSVTQS